MLHEINFWVGWTLCGLLILCVLAGLVGISLRSKIDLEFEEYDENIAHKIAPADSTRAEINKEIQRKNWIK
jgi:hypothetical protein